MDRELLVAGRRVEARWIAPSREGAPTAVFLHEGLGSLRLWKAFPDAFAARTGCGALVWSRYGNGFSEPLHEARGVGYMHDEALHALPNILAQFAIERPLLVGHSDGASIALLYAGTGAPLAGLILEAPHVFVEDVSVESIAAMRQTYENGGDLPRRMARHHADARRTFYGWNDIWLDPVFRSWNIEDALPSIEAPALLIQGVNDEYGTTAQLDAIARATRGATERVLLDACGHAPHRDQPEKTLEAMVRFTELFR